MSNEREKFESLHANMDILIAGLDIDNVFEQKGNLADSTVWNTGEAGDICNMFKYHSTHNFFSKVCTLSPWSRMPACEMFHR